MKNKKAILDTNLWIHFLISKNLAEIDDLLFDGSVKLIFSRELMEEFITISQRPKFERYFSVNKINELLRLFDKYGRLVDVSVEIKECRDSKDNFLLSLAVAGKVDYLVTGDSDLLILGKIKKTKIVCWSDFIKEIK